MFITIKNKLMYFAILTKIKEEKPIITSKYTKKYFMKLITSMTNFINLGMEGNW